MTRTLSMNCPTHAPLTQGSALRYLRRVFASVPLTSIWVPLAELAKYGVKTLPQLRELVPIDFVDRFPELFSVDPDHPLDGPIGDAMLIADPRRYFAQVYDGGWDVIRKEELDLLDRLGTEIRPLLAVYGVSTPDEGCERHNLNANAAERLPVAALRRREAASSSGSLAQHVAWELINAHGACDQHSLAGAITRVLASLDHQELSLSGLDTVDGRAAVEAIAVAMAVGAGKAPEKALITDSLIDRWGDFARAVLDEYRACSQFAREWVDRPRVSRSPRRVPVK